MAARHRSRRRALQVLFEWDMRGGVVDSAIEHYYQTLHSDEGDPAAELQPDSFMEELVRGTAQQRTAIDTVIEGKSEHWKLGRMPVVDRNVLRLAIYEMRKGEIAPPIVIDEAMQLARQFSGDESLSFINGLLDAVHRDISESRSGEASAAVQSQG